MSGGLDMGYDEDGRVSLPKVGKALMNVALIYRKLELKERRPMWPDWEKPVPRVRLSCPPFVSAPCPLNLVSALR